MDQHLLNDTFIARVVKTGILALALFSTSLARAADQFDRAEYFHATSSRQKKAGSSVKGTLSFNDERKTVDFLDHGGNPDVSIKCESVKTLLYKQTAKPRYAEAVLISPLFLLAHSKKHYLTIQYAGDGGEGQFVIIRLDKKNAQAAVAAAEAHTGEKVERVEEK